MIVTQSITNDENKISESELQFQKNLWIKFCYWNDSTWLENSVSVTPVEAIIRRGKDFTELDDAEELQYILETISDPEHEEPIQFDEGYQAIIPEHTDTWED